MAERIVDLAHERRIRLLPCAVCAKPAPSECHHVGARAKSRRAGSGNAACLCGAHHREYHTHGRLTFAAKYGMDDDALIEKTRAAHALRWPNVTMPPRDPQEAPIVAPFTSLRIRAGA